MHTERHAYETEHRTRNPGCVTATLTSYAFLEHTY